ncbi:hypothetical protein WCE55_09730 [Luteimonas sp. MJ293]|uniref:hypothetical protein n=1 Tax=Luteimonas sp. MJ146 TaxID=3129240 RepID=UPI0031BAA730
MRGALGETVAAARGLLSVLPDATALRPEAANGRPNNSGPANASLWTPASGMQASPLAPAPVIQTLAAFAQMLRTAFPAQTTGPIQTHGMAQSASPGSPGIATAPGMTVPANLMGQAGLTQAPAQTLPSAFLAMRANGAQAGPNPTAVLTSPQGTHPSPTSASASVLSTAPASVLTSSAPAATPAAAYPNSAHVAGSQAAAAQAAGLLASPAGNPQATALLQAAGNPQSLNPAAVAAQAAVPGQGPVATAGGNPMLAGTPAQARSDGVVPAHGHTVTTAARQRAGTGRSGLQHGISTTPPGHTGARSQEQSAEERADRTFHRLYWLLALTAYISLAFTVVLLLPLFGSSGTTLVPSGQQRSLTGLLGLAALGFGAGIGAWLLARRQG